MHNSLILDFQGFINEEKKQDIGSIRIFCDMDGVLTDFDRGFKRLKANHDHLEPKEYDKKHGKHSIWPLIDHRKEKFWKRLPWTKDGRELWDYIERYTPIILSSPSRSEYSIPGKMDWLKLNLGLTQKEPTTKTEDWDPESRMIFSNKKELFVKGKNDILIDDKHSNIEKWTQAGGTGIFHNDATDTIKILEEIISKIQGPVDDSETETAPETNKPEPEQEEGA